MKSCHICGGDAAFFKNVYDDRYGYPGSFKLLNCMKCRHKFLDAAFGPKELTELYTNYYPRSSWKVEDYRPLKEAVGFGAWLDGTKCSPIRWVPKNVRVLDVGCGFGESLGYYASRGCDAYGVEGDENIRRVAEKYGFKVHVGLFDPDIYQPEFFDYVTMAQVIEHVTDPLSTLKGIARILKPGGIAILSTPNSDGWGRKTFGRRWINWHAPYHIQHFSIKSMKIAAEKAGLIVKKYKTITSSEWLYYQWLHLITYPKMGVPSGFWSQKREKLTQRQNLLISLITSVHKKKINHLVTRLFDGLGLGDNIIYTLVKPSGTERI